MTVSNHPAPPDGFEPYAATNGFMALLGTMYSRRDADGGSTVGFRVRTIHLNHQDTMHGGMVATVADHVMGQHAASALGSPIATVHLGVDYLARVSEGSWLEVESRVDRQGKRMLFLACTGRVDGEPVFRANAVFSAIRR